MMNQSKKKIDLQDYRSLEKVAYENLLWILDKPFYFEHPEHFSLIQYGNQTVLKNHVKGVLNQLKTLDPTMSYLNVGMGVGILEAVAQSQGMWDIESTEWKDQEHLFKPFRENLGIDHYRKYVMEDVHSEDFQLKVEQKYDYSLFIRFFPINKKWCCDNKMGDIIKKFVDVSKGLVIIDSPNNFDNWGKLTDIADRYVRISDNGYSLLRFDSIDNFLTQI